MKKIISRWKDGLDSVATIRENLLNAYKYNIRASVRRYIRAACLGRQNQPGDTLLQPFNRCRRTFPEYANRMTSM